MPTPYAQDKIENWVSDFCMSDAVRQFAPAVREIAAEVLVMFLAAACARRDVEPAEVEEPDLKSALDTLARLNIAEEIRAQVPAVCAAFLMQLESDGRLSNGRLLGAYVKALTPGYLELASGKVKPITRPGAKIGRNESCPCGSGKKYKKCCG